MLRIVFDIDDTICDNNNRDYANAIPKTEVINKINSLYDSNEYEIVLFTARGMKSCNGDLEKIIKKNKKVLEEWLKQHCVKYHELIFGKPLGDLYVDDKCMEVREFVNSDFRHLSGGSQKSIIQMGRYVVKDFGSHEKLLRFKEWMKESKGICSSPHVVSYLYDRVYIDYIDGLRLDHSYINAYITNLVEKVLSFRSKKYDSFDMQYHIDNLLKNDCKETHNKINFCMNLLSKHEAFIKTQASFSHGDCILSNVFVKDTELIFIDPNFYKPASSYLFDLAKIRMSLDGYETTFDFSDIQHTNYLQKFDTKMKFLGLFDVVTAIEYMHLLRCYRYKNETDKIKLLSMLNKLEEDMKWKID